MLTNKCMADLKPSGTLVRRHPPGQACRTLPNVVVTFTKDKPNRVLVEESGQIHQFSTLGIGFTAFPLLHSLSANPEGRSNVLLAQILSAPSLAEPLADPNHAHSM